MSENFEDKVDIKETHGVGFNSGNIVNSTFAESYMQITKANY